MAKNATSEEAPSFMVVPGRQTGQQPEEAGEGGSPDPVQIQLVRGLGAGRGWLKG